MPDDRGAVARWGERAFAKVRVGVVARLRERRAELEEAIFARARDGTFDATGNGDEEYVRGLREAIAVAVGYGLRGIEQGEEFGEPVPAALLEQGRRAARVGVGVDTVLRRYMVGYAMLADFVIEEAESLELLPERLDRHGALRELLRAHTAVLERLTAAITAEYGRELEWIGRSREQPRAELVRALLAGAQADTRELDYDLDGWHVGVIATGAGAIGALDGLRAKLGCRLLSVPAGVPGGERELWAWLGAPRGFAMSAVERVVAAYPEREEAARGAERAGPPADVSLALGEPARGIEGWRSTHRQAQEALRVTLRRPRRLTRFADVALLAPWLEDPARAGTLIDTYLSPLDGLGDGGQALRQTLRAYFAAGQNMNAAAATLGVDRGTVRRRVRMIEEKLDRPLYARQAELQVAMRLEELRQPSGEGG